MLLSLATLAGACLVGNSQAQESVDIGSPEFGDAVRAYLLENPEVIFEAVDVYEMRQKELTENAAKNALDENAEQIYDETNAIVLGNPDASFAIVEFVDYNCGYCRKSHEEIQAILAEDSDLKILVRQFPILSQDSLDASKAVIAVGNIYGADKAREMHDRFYDDVQKASLESALALVDEMELDRAEVEAAMEGQAVLDNLTQTHDIAQSLEIEGTPGFIIGDELLRGYAPASAMKTLIDSKKS